jgi:cell wall-associated NlpC family hydrolase
VSRNQFHAGDKVPVSAVRPGDMIFYQNPGAPIHHVAMYIGDGRIVHAPRTGKPVQIDSVYYWEPPDFFGRP